jgi:hypothetical protein
MHASTVYGFKLYNVNFFWENNFMILYGSWNNLMPMACETFQQAAWPQVTEIVSYTKVIYI